VACAALLAKGLHAFGMTLGRVPATSRCVIATADDAEKQQIFQQRSDYCLIGNECLRTAPLIPIKRGRYTEFAAFQSRLFRWRKRSPNFVRRDFTVALFFALYTPAFVKPVVRLRTSCDSGSRPFGPGCDAPIFHYVMSRVHRGRQQVLPVVAVPDRIEWQRRGGRRRSATSGEFPGRLSERCGETGREAAHNG